MPELPEPHVEPAQHLPDRRAGLAVVDTRRALLYFPDARQPRDVRLWRYRHTEPDVAAIAGDLGAGGHPVIQITVD